MVQCIDFFFVSCLMFFLLSVCHVICKVNGYAWTAHLGNTRDFMGTVCEICTPLPAAELALRINISKLDCTEQKVDNLRNHWAYLAVFGLILKWKRHAIS